MKRQTLPTVQNFIFLFIACFCIVVSFEAYAQSAKNWWRDDVPTLPDSVTEEVFLKAFEYWPICRFEMPIRVSLRAPHGERFNMETPVGREVQSVVKIFREQIGIDFELVDAEEETNIVLYIWQDDHAEYSDAFPLNRMFVMQDRIAYPADASITVFPHSSEGFSRIFSKDRTVCLGAKLMLKIDRQAFRIYNGHDPSDVEQSEYIKHRVRRALYQVLGYLAAGEPTMQSEPKNYLPPPLYLRVLYDARLNLKIGKRPFLRELYKEMKGVKE